MTTAGKKGDYYLLSAIALEIIFGLIMLTSASSPVGEDRFNDSYFFVKRQIMYGLVPGFFIFLFFAKISYNHLKKIAFPFFAVSSLLLLLVLLPGIGNSFNKGARSWLLLFGFSFQPAEVAKLACILYFSSFLGAMGKRIEEFKSGFLMALLVTCFPIVLVVLQPDVGTVSILFSVVFVMLFLAGARLRDLGVLALSGAIGLFVLIKIAPYRIARLTTFLHPELDPQGIGYHINQAFLAVGSGGFFGLGYGSSRQKFQYLPEVHADSIFAIVAEEMGFIVSVLFLLLVLFICYRAFMIAKKSPDMFGRLSAGGVATLFMVQSILNIGAILGLLPLTGVPLPFVSHGGTSLVVTMASVGVLFNVSKNLDV